MKKGLKIGGHEIIASFGAQELGKYFTGAVDKSTLESWVGRGTSEHIKFRRFFQEVNKEVPGGVYDAILEDRAFLITDRGSFTYDIPVENDTTLHTTADYSHQVNAGKDGDKGYIEFNREFKEGVTLTPTVGSNISIMIVGEAENTGSGYLHTFQVVGSKYDTVPSRYLQKNEIWEDITHGSSEFGTVFASPQIGDGPGHVRSYFELGSVTGVEAELTDDANRGAIEGESSRNLLDRVEDFKRRNNLDDFLVRMDLGLNAGRELPNRDTANIGTLLEGLTHHTLDQKLARRILFQKAGKVKTTNGVTVFNDGLIHQLKRAYGISYGRQITVEHISRAADHLYHRIPNVDKNTRQIEIIAAEQTYNMILKTFERYVIAGLNRDAILLGADKLIDGVVKGDLKELEYRTPRFTQIEVPGIGTIKLTLDRTLGKELDGNRMSRDFRSTNRSEASFYALVRRTDNYRTVEATMPKGVTLEEGGNDAATAYIVKRRGPLITYGTIHGRMNSHYMPGGVVDASYKERSMNFWAYGTADVFLPFPEDMVLLYKSKVRK